MAKLSILGLYNYDPTIFDGLSLPTASDITNEAEKVADPWIPDKSDFISYLCMELAELELLYPSAAVLGAMITVWSRTHRPEWVQLYNTMLYKYNPIWNKDGFYKETHNLTITDDYSVTNMKTAHTGDVKQNVTGYDSNTYSPDTQTQQDTADTTNGTTKNTHSDRGTLTKEESGNIGVTMTQEMIRQQRDVVQFNLYDYIVQSFKRSFCLMVY